MTCIKLLSRTDLMWPVVPLMPRRLFSSSVRYQPISVFIGFKLYSKEEKTNIIISFFDTPWFGTWYTSHAILLINLELSVFEWVIVRLQKIKNFGKYWLILLIVSLSFILISILGFFNFCSTLIRNRWLILAWTYQS